MNTEQHTVTIPITDYNELLKSKSLIGAELITEQNDIYKALQSILLSKMSYQDQQRQVNPLVNIEIFIRVIKR